MPLREGPAITEVPPGIAIWANGSIGQRVTFTSSGSHQFTLRAKGTIAFGQWPQAQILIDGVAKAVFEVMSQDYASVAFNLTVEAGEREVSVAFINDALGGGEDRNLFVDYLRIEGAGAGTGGATATLIGTVGDDGLPNPPGQLTVQWTRLSGPAPVSFADPASSTTTATFTLLGDYQLQLQASDGKLQTADVLTVTVSGGGGVTNQNPTDLQDRVLTKGSRTGWGGTAPPLTASSAAMPIPASRMFSRGWKKASSSARLHRVTQTIWCTRSPSSSKAPARNKSTPARALCTCKLWRISTTIQNTPEFFRASPTP